MELPDSSVITTGPDVGRAVERLIRKIRTALANGGNGSSEHRTIVQVGVDLPALEVLRWLQAQEAEEKVYWEDRDQSLCIAGVGITDHILVSAPASLSGLCGHLREMIRLRRDGDVRYYGGMRFNPETAGLPSWKPFGAGRFVLPRFELRQEDGATRLLCNLLFPDDRRREAEILAAADALSLVPAAPQNGQYCPVARSDVPDRERWFDRVESILDLLRDDRGKVVLAREVTYYFDRMLDPLSIFKAVREATPGTFHFFIQPAEGTAFVGASPERLFSKRGRRIHSEAVAGTRSRGATPVDDRRLRNALLTSTKDRREHTYVRESICRSLSPLCDSLTADDEVSELILPRGRHLITRLHGLLHASVSSMNVLEALHPSPAVGGWPTEWAVERIEEFESFDRGWYAGPVGWLGSHDSEFAVAIRSGLVSRETLRLYSGAGIVEGSDPEEEWDEIEQKISDFIDALGLDC